DQMVIVDRDGQREVLPMRWGLIPSWAKDPAIGNRMINARAESLATKPAYREAFAKRRGLMVVDSYYEWRTNPSGPKTPFRIHRAAELPFTIAALWERWRSHDMEIETCSVITTDASEAMQGIHHRMPVIVAEDAADAWLSVSTPKIEIQAILSRGVANLIAYPVSLYVNAPSNDGVRCWESVKDE
ncbi:MAG: SOS response-associated peptidase, partial [Gemmatimonadaceae bacterium]